MTINLPLALGLWAGLILGFCGATMATELQRRAELQRARP